MPQIADKPLPPHFAETLASVSELGILNEQPNKIEIRLSDAVRDAAVRSGQKPMDAGWSEWVPSVLKQCKEAVHAEICAADASGLKKDYNDLLGKGLTPEGIASVSLVISQVINPAFAVSSVVIYLSVWIIKVGLNRWCTYSAKDATALKA
jgi:hypothetical protein